VRHKSSGTLDSSQQVVILGGSGFIGTHLTRVLTAQAVQVRIGDLQQSIAFPDLWTRCDVTDSASIVNLLSSESAIINLAAEHRDDVRPLTRYHQVNVGGAIEVCKAARKSGVQKIIFASSVAVYGFHQRAIGEDGPFEPFNEYGKTKLQAEGVYRAWADEDPARTLVIVRPTVVFGEGNRGNVYGLMHQIAIGRFFMVGSGTNIKSMAYVGNVAGFLAHSLTLGSGVHISNYVDVPDMNTRDLVANINRCLGRPELIRKIPKSMAMAGGHLLDVAANISGRSFPISAIRVRKFCETTQFQADRVAQWGFRPPHTLAEGLARTVDFEFRRR
jgi:GlcNAc-P-P-Und epimerase